jgi:hypothetical protein
MLSFVCVLFLLGIAVISIDEALKEMSKISRQRATVKASLISDASKARMLAALDEQMSVLDKHFQGAEAPQGASAAPAKRAGG